MPSTILWFPTDDFVDTEAERGQRINEDIGGAALAKWLSSELRASGLAVVEPWSEDHGWDFKVTTESGKYMLVCTIEDIANTVRQACVQVHLGWSSRSALDPANPILRKVIELIEARGASIRIE